jgi:predicted amidohydrolase
MGNGTVGLGAIQMRLGWYASADDFVSSVHRLAAEAKAQGADLIVYPEDIGLVMAFADDAEALAEAETLQQAVGALLQRRLQSVMTVMQSFPIGPMRALMFARAEGTRRNYEALFSSVAQAHSLYVVAGSAPLARRGSGTCAVYNTSCTFAPDGQVIATQRKVNLIDLEMLGGLDMVKGSPDEYDVVTTQLGVIGTGVCADCFDSALIGSLVAKGLQILVDPKANPKLWTDDEAEVNTRSSFDRCQEFPIYAVQAFGVGALAGIPFQGRSAIYAPASLTPDGSGIVALARTHDSEEVVAGMVDVSKLR